MGRVALIRPPVHLVPADPAPAARLESPKTGAKRRICEHVLALAARAGSDSAGVGIDLFRAAWAAGTLAPDVRAALVLARPKSAECPDRATLYRWLEQYRTSRATGSLAPLAPKAQGRERQVMGWEARALHLYRQPSKPAAAEVARQLREEGQTSATEPRVRRYLASLPTDVLIAGRMGERLRRAQHGDYVRRTTANLRAGDIYVGDGHTIDVYLQHPTGRRPWRPELTVWLDVRSRCVAGWWISESESGLSTLFALSAAVQARGHIPAMIHVDNGSGYAAQIHTDEATGLFARLGISVMNALPYNARAKPVERYFRTMEESFGRRWPSYCGYSMDEEAKHALLKRYKAGDWEALPTLDQYLDGLRAWIAGYEAEEHPECPGKTRRQVWDETFEAHPPEGGAALWWPRVERIVNRRSIALDGREYRHPALAAFNKTDLRDGKVLVEYDIHDDAMVRVLTPDGRWICDAELVRRRDYVSASRIEDARAERTRAQTKRLELQLQEVRDRAALTVDAADRLRAIDHDTGEVSALTHELAQGRIGHDAAPAGTDEPELDIWGDE